MDDPATAAAGERRVFVIRAAVVAVAVLLVGAPAARATEVSSAQLRSLAERAVEDPGALRDLRQVDSVDGRAVDIAGALQGARGRALQARLRMLADTPETAPASGDPRRDARAVLAEKRFHGESVPGPFRGLIRRLRGLVPDLGPLLRKLDGVIPGPRSVTWLVLALVFGGLGWWIARRFLTTRIRASAEAEQAAAPAGDDGRVARAARGRGGGGGRSRRGAAVALPRGAAAARRARGDRLPPVDLHARGFALVALGGLRRARDDLRRCDLRRPRAGRAATSSRRASAGRGSWSGHDRRSLALRARFAGSNRPGGGCPVRDTRVRIGLGCVAGLVLLAIVVGAIGRLTPTPKGPRSSTYATSPDGAAAYASVLARNGHPVRRLRTSVAKDAPPLDQTLFVLEPSVIEPKEAHALGRWVRRGGRLVVGLRGDAGWLEEVLANPPSWDFDGPVEHAVLAPTAETAGVRQVLSGGGGAWHELGRALPFLGPADAPLAVSLRSGRGTVVLLADVTPLQNGGLARADNAAFGLALTGGPRRTAAFLETVHGYGVSRGFGGLPARVKWVLIGLALTGLVALWAAGRRFGPPEEPEDEPPPPRIEYVEALAASLARAKPDKEERS